MSCETDQNILKMFWLIDEFFNAQSTPEVELKIDIISMFLRHRNDGTFHPYFGKLRSFKAKVTELMMVQDCHNGKSVHSMSKEYGISAQAVYRTLKKHNCKPKRTKRIINGFAVYHKMVERELIRLMHDDGVSIRAIANKQKVSVAIVNQALRGD